MHRHAGFTLIELMLSLAVAAVLAAMGAPAMAGLIAHSHELAAETQVYTSLNHARQLAVVRNARMRVCPSNDGRHCSEGEDWQSGWIILPQAPDAQVGAAPLRVFPAMPAGTRIITSAGRHHVDFHPNGSAAGTNLRFTICHVRRGDGKSVVVSNTGRVRMAAPEPDRLQACLAGLH